MDGCVITCVCLCVHARIPLCLCVYVYTCTCVRLCVFIHVCVCAFAGMCIPTGVCVANGLTLSKPGTYWTCTCECMWRIYQHTMVCDLQIHSQSGIRCHCHQICMPVLVMCATYKTKLQTLVYDIILPTTAIISCTICFWKLSANWPFFTGAQMAAGMRPKLYPHVFLITVNNVPTSTA